MGAISKVCGSCGESCTSFSLKPTHRRILQVALGTILLAGITLSILSFTGYLSPIVSYVSIPASLLTLIALILITCGKSKDKSKSLSDNPQADTPSDAPKNPLSPETPKSADVISVVSNKESPKAEPQALK